MKWLPRELGNALFILFGILSAGMGLHGFLLSSGFIDGGVTGISMLLAQTLTRPPLPILILVINLPFVALGYRQIGRTFAIRSAASDHRIIGLPCDHSFSRCHARQAFDRRLRRVLHRSGNGSGDARRCRPGRHRHRRALDQQAEPRVPRRRRHPGLNIVIFLSAAFFLGVEKSLYSILTYVSASKTLDFLLHGIEEYTAITIVSEQSEAIRDAINCRLERGVTVFKGRGGRAGTTWKSCSASSPGSRSARSLIS